MGPAGTIGVVAREEDGRRRDARGVARGHAGGRPRPVGEGGRGRRVGRRQQLLERPPRSEEFFLPQLTFVEVFGEAGRHARAAVGVASLPYGVAVEIDGVFEIR